MRQLLRGIIKTLLKTRGLVIERLPAHAYNEDGLRSLHNCDFLKDPSFADAYQRGIGAAGADYKWHWRVHIGLWCAYSASKLKGDFVECGVNRGFLSSAIMEYLEWDSLDRLFYLLDTFEGLDERFLSAVEMDHGAMERSRRHLGTGFYVKEVESVRENFSQWTNVRIVRGTVPESLRMVEAKEVAYLHLDMNCAAPEVAALKFFWGRIVPGGFVLLDDYAYCGHEAQKDAMDRLAKEMDVRIVALPTGQGLLLKPA